MANPGEDDLISSIFGEANPGDNGKADEGGDDNNDTGPVAGDEDDLDADLDLNEATEDDNAEPDAGDESLADDDPFKKKPGRPKKPVEENQEEVPAPQTGNDPFAPDAKISTDKAGNVIHNGKIIAKAGREARMYMSFRKTAVADRQDAAKMAQSLAKISEGARQLVARHEELKNQKTIFETSGLSPEDQSLMLQVALAYKKSPLEGLKFMLTRAHMAGVDIKSLGAGGAIDPKLLMDDMKSHFTELLKPVTQQTSNAANQERIRNEATGFFERNPRAKDVGRFLGGSHKLGLILKEAGLKSPDLTLDELFEKLDYALVKQFGAGFTTAPVAKPAAKPNGSRRPERRMERNFKSSVSKGAVPSFDDIAKSVLRDAADAAESRGF